MKLIIGLGNPGAEYEETRHNAGFMAIDEIARQVEAPPFKQEKKFHAEISSTTFHDQKIILAKPATFMNLSGEAVAALRDFYKVKADDIFIIYDDIDLPLGQIRVKKDGSPGTHNGMKSIVQRIGGEFPRIRVGIESRGETAPEQQDTSSFVLTAFAPEEEDTAQKSIKKATNALKTALEEGLEEAMNQFN